MIETLRPRATDDFSVPESRCAKERGGKTGAARPNGLGAPGKKNGGVDRNRTGLSDFADRCLTSWLPRLEISSCSITYHRGGLLSTSGGGISDENLRKCFRWRIFRPKDPDFRLLPVFYGIAQANAMMNSGESVRGLRKIPGEEADPVIGPKRGRRGSRRHRRGNWRRRSLWTPNGRTWEDSTSCRPDSHETSHDFP